MKRLKDPNENLLEIKKVRVSVRALLLDEENRVGMLKISGFDIFGQRNHFESVGGGLEPFEDEIIALKREVREETGFHINEIKYLDTVIDEYALLSQVNVHHYYIARIVGKEKTQLTDRELCLIKGIEFKDPKTWIAVLSQAAFGVNALVHQRELLMMKDFLNQQYR